MNIELNEKIPTIFKNYEKDFLANINKMGLISVLRLEIF